MGPVKNGYIGLIISVLSAFVFIHHVQGQMNTNTESYIARAGKIFVSESEFIERYELTPGLGGRNKAQQEIEKQELLYSIIAEKLLVQEAFDRGLNKDPVLQQSFMNIRKLLSRDELYRQEISQKVKITPKEINAGILRAQRELLLQYLFFEKEDDARFVHKQLKNANSFNHLHVDSSFSVLQDTVTLIWGDADPVMENAAYNLKVNDVSPVLSIGDGFYIIALKSAKRSSYFTSMQLDVLRNKVENILRLRKEKVRLDEFVREALKNKIAYGRPEILRLLSQTLSAMASNEHHDSVFTITVEIARQVRSRCEKSLDDTVVVVGKESWELSEIIDKLVASGFYVTNHESRAIFAKLNIQLKVWSQQELLAQEALDRRLDQIPAVSRKIEMWNQFYLAEHLKQKMKDDVKVSDGEVWSYMKDRDSSLAIPMVQIRELRTTTLAVMSDAMNDLEKTKSLEQTIVKWSCDPHAKETGGVTPYFSILSRQPIGALAWQMQKGERYGPVTLQTGPIIFELVDKKIPAEVSDTGFATRFNSAKEGYVRLKQRGVLNVFLSRLGRKMGFTIFNDRLERIELTSVPMVTYKILGFGGKIFAVPFVSRQIEWLNVDNPEKIPLP
jgi:hypothetical protein